MEGFVWAAGAGFGEFRFEGGFAGGTTALDGVPVCKLSEGFAEAAAGFVVEDGLPDIRAFGIVEAAGAAWSFAIA